MQGRYQIVAIHPEGEPSSWHVIDHSLELEVACLDSKEQAELFRNIRLAVDGLKPEQLYLN